MILFKFKHLTIISSVQLNDEERQSKIREREDEFAADDEAVKRKALRERVKSKLILFFSIVFFALAGFNIKFNSVCFILLLFL